MVVEELHRVDIAKAFDLVFAGKSKFTIKSTKTGKHFTYRIKRPRQFNGLYFVSILTGSDNQTDYTYIGTVSLTEYKHSYKSKIQDTALGVVSFKWFFDHLITKTLNDQIEFYHMGLCCRCGRELTHPASILSGLGPECVKLQYQPKSNHYEHN